MWRASMAAGGGAWATATLSTGRLIIYQSLQRVTGLTIAVPSGGSSVQAESRNDGKFYQGSDF